MAAPASVEDYLAALPDEKRAVLQELRQTIRRAAPEATESISYQMPTFKVNGRFLVSYAAFKQHCSLFPATRTMIERYGDELQPHLAGKGTIRFTVENPLPASLVTRIVATRLEEEASRPRR